MTQYICTHNGGTLLANGRAYTRKSVHYDAFGCEMWEMNECPGFLFGPWRFDEVDDHWRAMFQAVGLPLGGV